ncbi:MAG: hypothetical protein J7L78_02420 [Dehalococcoidales bacterium]|nr:hypothetical protein [Dehalococcoidales bacterium]
MVKILVRGHDSAHGTNRQKVKAKHVGSDVNNGHESSHYATTSQSA